MSDRKFWAWLFALLVATRLAGFAFGVVNLDEDEFCVIGSMVWHGALSYVDVAEFKPPLTHLFFAPAGMAGGVSIWPMRVLGVLWLFATCLVLARAAREWTGDELAGRAAAVLALLACLCEVPAVNAELLMNLPLALALLSWVRREHLRAGLWVGVASLFKHQGAVVVGAFGIAVLLDRDLKAAVLLTLGFAAPWAAAAGFWASRGHLAEFYDWMVLRNLGYARSASIFSWARAAAAIAVCVAGTAVPWALAVRQTFSRPRDKGLLLALWLTWLAVAAGGRFYEHYFLQFVPPLAVVGAPAAAELIRRGSRALRTAAVVAAALCLLGYTGYTLARGFAGRYPNQDAQVGEVSAWLRDHTPPDARIFVWGHAPQIYYLSQRRPGARYLTAATQMGGFDPSQLPAGFDVTPYRSDRDVQILIGDLEAHRTGYVVDTAPANIHDWAKVPLDKFPALDAYLRAHYRPAGDPAGARVLQRVR